MAPKGISKQDKKPEEEQTACSCSTPTTPRSTPSTPRSTSPIVSGEFKPSPEASSAEQASRQPIRSKDADVFDLVRATKSMDPLVDAIYNDALKTYINGKDVPKWVLNEVETAEAQEDPTKKPLVAYRK